MTPPIPNHLKPGFDAQRRQEFQLQQDRAFQSISLLASGIAHDFSNVIAGILGSAEVLKMDSPPASADNPVLEQIFTASERAHEMIRQLRNFSQRSSSKRTLISLPPVIEESLKTIRPNLPAAVEISHHLAGETPAVLADAAQIQQVVIHLCTNARHSLAGETGRIEVRLENCNADAGLTTPLGLRDGPHVRLSVRDNGNHFSKGILGRMFEPFACKQPTGHNSGLELFAVREIVHAHEGEITVSSAPGEGTVFQIYLPVPANDQPGTSQTTVVEES